MLNRRTGSQHGKIKKMHLWPLQSKDHVLDVSVVWEKDFKPVLLSNNKSSPTRICVAKGVSNVTVQHFYQHLPVKQQVY